MATPHAIDGLDASFLANVDRRLAAAEQQLATRYPGDPGNRQPVHTVYVPADRFHAETVAEWGRAAIAAMDADGGTPDLLAHATGIPADVVGTVVSRVRTKLARQPIEDLRVDFEDGYGSPPDAVEDAAAHAAAVAHRMRALWGGVAPEWSWEVGQPECPRPGSARSSTS